MPEPNFLTFRYDHGVEYPVPLWRWLLIGALAVAAIAMLIHRAHFQYLYDAKEAKGFLLMALLLMSLAAISLASGRTTDSGLMIGPRFLVCGKSVVYYQKLAKVRLWPGASLELVTIDGWSLSIDADSFPTRARKPDKVRTNQLAKFDKARDKILTRVRAVVPPVPFEVVGRA